MKVTDRWYSDRLGQDISVARWGTYGAPVLLFPTAGGDAEEVERHHMIAHLEPLIAAGRAKVYSVDSVAGRALAQHRGTVEYRLALFNAYHETIAARSSPPSTPTSAGSMSRSRSPDRLDRRLQRPRDHAVATPSSCTRRCA